jgi:hypothetical protein
VGEGRNACGLVFSRRLARGGPGRSADEATAPEDASSHGLEACKSGDARLPDRWYLTQLTDLKVVAGIRVIAASVGTVALISIACLA